MFHNSTRSKMSFLDFLAEKMILLSSVDILFFHNLQQYCVMFRKLGKVVLVETFPSIYL